MPKPYSASPKRTAAARSSRERLLAAAKTQFATKGYEQTTTAAIVRLAKTSESQLMKHFQNKQGVLEAIFAAGWRAITAAAEQAIKGESAHSKLGIIMRIVMSTLESDPELRSLLLMEGRRLRNGQRVVITDDFLAFVQLLDDVLRELQTLGLLRPTLHPQAVRSALMGAMEGLLRDSTLAKTAGYPAQYDPNDVSEMFKLLLGSFLAPQGSRSMLQKGDSRQQTIKGRRIALEH